MAKIFYHGDTGLEIERRKPRFKDFIKNFKYEVFRRETRFTIEGRKNDKVYIISRGDAKLFKQMKVKQDRGDTVKSMEIFYLREGSVIGA